MIVDCHTHINFADDGSVSPEHLAASETVDVSIVLGRAGPSSGEVNKRLSEYVNKHKDKMAGFGFLDPSRDTVGGKSLASVKDKLGLKGVVLYCSDCGFHPVHSKAMRLYESAAELGMAVFFHNSGHGQQESVLDYAQPFLLDEVARTFTDLKIVIGTMGEPFVGQTLAMAAKHENVYADLTIRPANLWQVYNTVVAAYEHGIMDKLLFGSGFPLGKAGECIETLLGFNKLLGDTTLPTVPRGDIRNVIERDTLKVLGIKD